MRRAESIIWLITAIGTAVALALTLPEALRAHADANAAAANWHADSHSAMTLIALRAEAKASTASDPATTLAQRVAKAMSAAGLPRNMLESVSPESTTRGDTSRRLATITLSSVTLSELGRFLDAWRTTEPHWTPIAIDLRPSIRNRAQPGTDLPVRAVLSMESRAPGGDRE